MCTILYRKALRLGLLAIAVFSYVAGWSQSKILINPRILNKQWDAYWITLPESQGYLSGAFEFRKSIELSNVPASMIIHVSADQRYKLYVNGQYVCNGPARGSLYHWNFETIDIARYLNKGKNVVAALVWNCLDFTPIAQDTYYQTGFILQTDEPNDSIFNTNKTWKVLHDTAYSLYPIEGLFAYMAGPGEKFDGSKHPWNWKENNYEDSNWQISLEINRGLPEHANSKQYKPERILVARQIPAMERRQQFFKAIRRSEGIDATGLLQQRELTIPANVKVKILLDQGELTNAYPYVRYSKGRGAEIKLTYSESLFIPGDTSKKRVNTKDMLKGNRDSIDGKLMIGNYDIFIADGASNRIVEPLWWRCFRYVQLEITTKEDPLILQQPGSFFTAYPLEQKAAFASSRLPLANIYKTGWHTQRLCAGETFFDCPYYEQMQYVGDTRIQGLITFYGSGDSTLWRKAITDFYDSRQPFGLVMCAYPGSRIQLIPGFSLLWIAMLNDYRMHCSDDALIKRMLPAVMDNLQWFQNHLQPNGMLGKLEWWNFIDWVKDSSWERGVPSSDKSEQSSINSLLYVYALQQAIELFNSYGYTQQAADFAATIVSIKEAVYKRCWDARKQLLADNADMQHYSQHAQILAVLVDLLPPKKQQQLMLRTYQNDSIASCSYYFRFYMAEAMKKTGLGGRYLDMLEPWQTMLANGLTTFSEESEPSRSDCHAWSASPTYHFLSLVCGIQPASAGFNKVKIAPNPGDLEWIEGSMPHKFGTIHLKLNQSKNGVLIGVVELPVKLYGHFEWKGKKIKLQPGMNKIHM